jgi:photosystem II stability/assembly factor-like uncharacterized protein
VRKIRLNLIWALALLAGAAPTDVEAQRARASAPPPALVAGVPDSAVLAHQRFRSIGPALMSGRISDVAVPVPARPGERAGKTFYVAAAGGGVWKTTNGGVTYEPVFDDQRVSSIGAVAVAPSNADIVWVGTGESNNLRSSSWGDGIYRSMDAGATWTHMGLPRSQHIPRIVVHPTNPDVVFVAAMGPLWSGGGERGFYKTTDGGRTWRNTLSAGPYTGVTDIVLDPRNPDVIFATTYQRDRRAYSFVAGGPESGIWKSTDGGERWTPLTEGLPTSDMGRVGLAVSLSQPRTLYATVDAEPVVGGIYRSDDEGASWRRVNELQSIPWFFGQIRIDPQDPERIYHLGVSLSVSDDGGATFRRIAGNTHADHHAMWIDPADPEHLIIGNDGGLFVSHDRGETWDFALNLPVATFYAIGVDNRDPYWIYGGLQDNGTFAGPSATRTNTGVTNADWVRVGGGDGFYAVIDPEDHNIAFAESQNGVLFRFDFATQERKGIRPPAEEGIQDRYNWSAPLLISPHDRKTLYFASNYLFRSRDRGDSWERLGPDLSRNLNRDSLPIMGLAGPGGHRRNEGVADFGNITTVDESPLREGLLYVGTDDGLLQVSRDGGATWTRVDRFRGVPDMTYVSRVIASAHDEATMYITFDGHRSNDFTPYVLRSTDYGRTFTSIAANLPADAAVYVIREHHRNPDLLVVGTEYGVFVSLDRGRRWTQLRNGIAPAPVHDVIIHPRANDLIVGTHGRGIYVLDDIAALERLAAASRGPAYLFAPPAATIQNAHGGARIPGNRNYTTENPRTRPATGHSAAMFTYFAGPVLAADTIGSIAVLDASGAVVREVPAPLRPGVHRVDWDLRWSQPVLASAAQPAGAADPPAAVRATPGGPFVFPGSYTVQLRSHGTAEPRVLAQAAVMVRPDPLLTLTDVEYRQLHDARMRARDLQARVVGLAQRLEATRERLAGEIQDSTAAARQGEVRAQVDELLTALRGPARAGQPQGPQPAAFAPGSGAAAQALFARTAGVASAIGTTHFLPTPAQQQALDEVDRELTDLSGRVGTVLSAADVLLRDFATR